MHGVMEVYTTRNSARVLFVPFVFFVVNFFKMLSPVIGMALQQAPGAIELFGNHHPYHGVRQRQWRE